MKTKNLLIKKNLKMEIYNTKILLLMTGEKKLKKDFTTLSDKYIEPVLFGTGEDFKSKEWKIKDEIIEPFKASAKDVAQNDIMSDAIITIGDDR